MNRIFLSLAGLLMCLAASHVDAGAWSRGKGKTFSVSSATFTWPDQRELKFPNIYGSTYLEHGITPRLRMGPDMSTPVSKHPTLEKCAKRRRKIGPKDLRGSDSTVTVHLID